MTKPPDDESTTPTAANDFYVELRPDDVLRLRGHPLYRIRVRRAQEVEAGSWACVSRLRKDGREDMRFHGWSGLFDRTKWELERGVPTEAGASVGTPRGTIKSTKEQSMNIKVGDSVHTKLGGPSMLVVYVDDTSVGCFWYGTDLSAQSASLPPSVLVVEETPDEG